MKKLLHPLELKNVSYAGNIFKFQKKLKGLTFFTATLMLMFFSFTSFAGYHDLKIEKVYFSNDSTEVLKKCIELPQLQQYYPKQTNGTSYALKVMQHGVSFSLSTNISHNGKSVLFLSKSQINENNEEAYFYFNEFVITGDKARVDFAFNYNFSNEAKMQKVSLELQKISSGWVISQTKIETR